MVQIKQTGVYGVENPLSRSFLGREPAAGAYGAYGAAPSVRYRIAAYIDLSQSRTTAYIHLSESRTAYVWCNNLSYGVSGCCIWWITLNARREILDLILHTPIRVTNYIHISESRTTYTYGGSHSMRDARYLTPSYIHISESRTTYTYQSHELHTHIRVTDYIHISESLTAYPTLHVTATVRARCSGLAQKRAGGRG